MSSLGIRLNYVSEEGDTVLVSELIEYLQLFKKACGDWPINNISVQKRKDYDKAKKAAGRKKRTVKKGKAKRPKTTKNVRNKSRRLERTK